MKYKLMAVAAAGVVLVFLVFPQVVSESAAEGLLMWFQVVLPALLPFSIVSTLLLRLGMTDTITKVVAPFIGKLLGISRKGCYPVVVGMLSGYPLGAATVAHLCRSGEITTKEGNYILHFCNNASPMFLMEYIGVSCLGWKQPIKVLVFVYAAGFLGCVLERILQKSGKKRQKKEEEKRRPEETPVPKDGQKKVSFMQALDESIMSSFTILTKVGGYIMLFSIVAGVIRQGCLISTENKALLSGLLEITVGAKDITAAFQGRAAVSCLMGFVTFGGLSSAAQTASVIRDAGLSMKSYLLAKVRQGIIAMVLVWFFG